MRRCFLACLYAALAVISVLFIHKISPTNLAGPGFDIVVYPVAILVGIGLFSNGLKNIQRGNKGSYVIFFINALGLILTSWAVYHELKK